MQNNNFRPASDTQINYLKRLGYTGNTEGLSNEDASNLIQQYRNGASQQPTPQPQPQPTYYGQPTVKAQAPMIQPQQDFNITTRAGEVLALDKAIVDAYVCANLTEPEYKYFFTICKTFGLNPFLKDIYAIKFGNQPATFVIDYKVLQQSVDENPMFDGLKTGVLYADANGIVSEREGAYLLPNETLIGAWCDVFRKDRSHPNRTYALYSENVKYTKDGTPNTNWATKPVFMITKVAKAQALRETFPNLFSNNTYTSDEMPSRDEDNVINADLERNSTASVKAHQEEATASYTPPIDFEN